MDSNSIIWAVIAAILVLPPALGLMAGIAERRKEARAAEAPARESGAGESEAGESTPTEHTDGQEIAGERDRLLDAKNLAEKAYAERVSVAEREFNARKVREDIRLRAAEMLLEHAQEFGRGQLGFVRDDDDAVEVWEHESAFVGQPFATNASPRWIEALKERRSQRILSAREHLAEVMLERHLAVAAAEKRFAAARSQRADVLSAAAALEAFEHR